MDRNRAIGRAHSRTSACVSAQHAPPGRFDPTTWMWFTSDLLRTGGHGLGTLGINLLTTHSLPAGSVSRRGAIHATARKNMHVPCHWRRCFGKNEETTFCGQKAVIDVSEGLVPSREAGVGWSDSLQSLGRIAPGVGRFAPPPARGVPLVRMGQRAGVGGARGHGLVAALRELGNYPSSTNRTRLSSIPSTRSTWPSLEGSTKRSCP